jgi:hypothetical protein
LGTAASSGEASFTRAVNMRLGPQHDIEGGDMIGDFLR